MAEYIDREALREAVKKYAIETKYDWTDAVDLEEFEKILDNMPKTDVAPVRRGQWKYYRKQGIATCTECSFERHLDDDFGRAVACPNCGAYMEGADNGE